MPLKAGVSFLNEINKRIREIRKSLNLTQKDVAERLEMGLSTYSQREREGNIEADFLVSLAKIFNVDIRTILYGEDEFPHFNNEQDCDFKLTAQEMLLIKILRNTSAENNEKIYQMLCDIYEDK